MFNLFTVLSLVAVIARLHCKLFLFTPFYAVNHYQRMDKTSWTDSTIKALEKIKGTFGKYLQEINIITEFVNIQLIPTHPVTHL